MSLDVLSWRREVHWIYQEARHAPDPASGHALWCRERQALFTRHPASANQSAVLRVAPYNPDLRYDVPVEPVEEPARLEIPTGTDGVVPFGRIGRVTLDGLGPLDVWWLESYGGGVWVPFRDASPDTYGGGRYLIDTVKGADLGGTDGRLVLDLNFAYNPSCAYDERWACPLAPPGNILAVEINAGELLPTRG